MCGWQEVGGGARTRPEPKLSVGQQAKKLQESKTLAPRGHFAVQAVTSSLIVLVF